MKILTLADIKASIDLSQIIAAQEEGFRLYSAGKVNVPPVGYLKQNSPPGSYHIKYGVINDDDVWVIKIAGGPSALPLSGMMIAISTKTGKPEAMLMDDGYLTQLRTAVAGYICAKYLAPKSFSAIGVIGTGQQARMQVEILRNLTDCRVVYVYGRNSENASNYKNDMTGKGFTVNIASSPSEVAHNCNFIVTTTASREPLLRAVDIQPGTHITAMGADAPGKQELDPALFGKADIIAVDSKVQCIDHGEIYAAYKCGIIADKDLIEIGELVVNAALGRTEDEQITIADLTGVAIQDIQIAKSILGKFD